MKIAMISFYLPSGSKIGVGHQVHNLANELVRTGHDVDVFSVCPPVPGAVYGHRPVVVSGRWHTFGFASALRRLDFSDFDVVHAHGDDYWLWRRRAGAHIRTLHGSCFEEALHIRGARERLRMVLLGLSEVLATLVADRTVVVSPATRRWTPWVRSVIPNGVDTAVFRPDPAARESRPVVLFVGTWLGRKRGRLLAEQFATVRRTHPDAELWMVSQDVPAGAGPGVRALGRVDEDELARLYRRAWVFCLPSAYEGFGIPYAEAMASGLPVVATPNVGARYVTDEGAAGVLVEAGSLGSTLAGLLADPAALEQWSRAGSARSVDFALADVARRYVELYRTTARGRRGPGSA